MHRIGLTAVVVALGLSITAVAGLRVAATPVVVTIGVLLTAALGGLVHVLGQRSAHAHRVAEERTRELAETNDRLSAVNDRLAATLTQLNRRAAVDRLVQRATWQVSHALTVEDALERLRMVLLDINRFDRVAYSVRVDDRRVRVEAVAGPAAELLPRRTEYTASERLSATFTTRELVVTRDTAEADDGTIEHALAERGIRGVMVLPLVARGEVAGVLTLASMVPLALSPKDVELLSRVADGIAGPIVTLLGLEAERLATEQLRQLDELKEEFVGVVAHDLKAPLAVVSGFAGLLLEQCREGPLDPEFARKGLAAMQRAALDQERLVADLLESQRLALGVAVPTPSRLVLPDLVRETIDDLAAGTGARVTFDDRSHGAAVSADAEWVRRVVTNLATNAWKYGSPAIDVRVTCVRGAVRVEVTDRGPGIPAADVPRLFQRFSRLGHDRARPTGTGLGLYICRQLVESQGGQIGVESTEGRGSTFWFELQALESRPAPA